MYYISLVNIFFAGLIEYSLGKNFLVIFSLLNIILYMGNLKTKRVYMILIMWVIVYVLSNNTILSATSVERFSAAFYNILILVVFLYLSIVIRKSKNIDIGNNISHLQFIMMFQTIVAILQSQEILPVLTQESRPSGFYAGALVFGFVQTSVAIFLIRTKPNFLTFLNILLLFLSIPLHRSKFVFMALFLILVSYPFFVSKRLHVKFFMGILATFAGWYSLPIVTAILISLENSERVRRILYLWENTSLMGGNLLFELGPLGSFPSTESFILYFFAAFGIFALPFLFIALYRIFALQGVVVLSIALSVTEPLLSYSCLLFLLFTFSYFSSNRTNNVVFNTKSW